jgi:hypothetical protein
MDESTQALRREALGRKPLPASYSPEYVECNGCGKPAIHFWRHKLDPHAWLAVCEDCRVAGADWFEVAQ